MKNNDEKEYPNQNLKRVCSGGSRRWLLGEVRL